MSHGRLQQIIDMRNFIKRALMVIGALYVSFSTFAGSFEAGEGKFLLNGEPYIVKAAELHYPRIPRPYWDQRIKMCKALGMNTVCLYTFWNVHESEEGIFDFTGNNDIREFILLCKQNGLNVILRPGPYVCAEWEMGGLPWWLLKKKNISLRDTDPYFMQRVEVFEKVLAQQLKDLTISNDGPIIMIQVENEYGAYGENKPYVSSIRDLLRNLYGEDILLFQCDWSSNFTLNGLDDLVWTMNFGTGTDIDSQFSTLKNLRPTAPLICSEFWSGWFDKWGAPHETRSATEMIQGIDEMLSKGISFSLYMTHGGTNWGHWAGANSPGYAPDVTSYDYDAPINENGAPTEKFRFLRKTLQKYNGKDSLPPLPPLIEPIKIDTFKFTQVAPLWDNLPEMIETEGIKTMEEYDQGYGSIIYTTLLPEVEKGAVLHLEDVHDFAQVFINNDFIGTIDRRLGENSIVLPKCKNGDSLIVLVEAMGRINFGIAIKDFKGITERAYITQGIYSADLVEDLTQWWVYLLPDKLDFYTGMQFSSLDDYEKGLDGRYPRGVYRGTFNIDRPSDTFLSFETWGKGLVYLNGHPLGRIWNIGPQQTLYAPGCWMNEGTNEVLVFDIMGPCEALSTGLDFPVNNTLQGETPDSTKNTGVIQLGSLSPVYGGAFPQTNGWKRQMFESPETGRYLTISALNSVADNFAAIAEFYVLDKKGVRLSREDWKIYYADSEDKTSGNHTAEKIFDLQESTYWQSDDNDFPHVVVIDMGGEETVGGIEYLPRQESGNPGAIAEYQIYLTADPPSIE